MEVTTYKDRIPEKFEPGKRDKEEPVAIMWSGKKKQVKRIEARISNPYIE